MSSMGHIIIVTRHSRSLNAERFCPKVTIIMCSMAAKHKARKSPFVVFGCFFVFAVVVEQ